MTREDAIDTLRMWQATPKESPLKIELEDELKQGGWKIVTVDGIQTVRERGLSGWGSNLGNNFPNQFRTTRPAHDPDKGSQALRNAKIIGGVVLGILVLIGIIWGVKKLKAKNGNS